MTQYFSLGLVFCCCWGAAKITCCPPPCSEQEACVAQGSKLPAINNVNLGQLANPRHYPICSVVQPPGQTPYTALMCAAAESSYHLNMAPDIILFVRLHKSDILLKGSSLYFSKVIAIGPCWHWTLADVSNSPLQCSVEGIKNLKGADPLNWYSGSLSVNKWWDLEGSCRQQRRDGHGGDDPATVWLITALMIISVMTWPCHAGTLLAPGGWERQAWNKKTLQESKKLRLTSQIWNFWQISRCEIGLKSAWECHKSIGRGVGDFICKGQQSV